MTERKDIRYLHALEDSAEPSTRRMSYALWTVQVLLALLFLFAGGAKLALPAAALEGPVPVLFLRFIGVCEVLGALGLILPGIFRTARILTPVAAAGLVIIMIGATIINVIGSGIPVALITLLIGLVAAFVYYGRRQAILVRPNRSEKANSAYRAVSAS
jgi:DoxX-like protein